MEQSNSREQRMNLLDLPVLEVPKLRQPRQKRQYCIDILAL
jgi:hypothetical protein